MLQKNVDKNTIVESTGDLLGSLSAKKVVKKLSEDSSFADRILKYLERVEKGHDNGMYLNRA